LPVDVPQFLVSLTRRHEAHAYVPIGAAPTVTRSLDSENAP
jgi:hypothetical protein